MKTLEKLFIPVNYYNIMLILGTNSIVHLLILIFKNQLNLALRVKRNAAFTLPIKEVIHNRET